MVLHQDPGSAGGLAQTNGGTAILVPQRHPPSGGVAQRAGAVSPNNPPGVHSGRVHSKPEEIRSGSHLGPGLHKGQVQDRPGQGVPARGPYKRAPSHGQILLHGRTVQDSTPLPGSTGSHGSHLAVGGVLSPSHASHPVVPEAALEPRNPRVMIQDPGSQSPQPSASVVVSQGTPFTRSALFLIHHYHHYYYGCEHGGLGRSLPTARADHGTIQWPLLEGRTPTPHKCVGAQSSSYDPTPSGAGNPQSVSVDRVQHYGHSVVVVVVYLFTSHSI